MNLRGIVYCATSRIDGRQYVGSTIHALAFRRRQHETTRSASGAKSLQAAIRRDGAESFDWRVLCEAPAAELEAAEEQWIDELRPALNRMARAYSGRRYPHQGKTTKFDHFHPWLMSSNGQMFYRCPPRRTRQAAMQWAERRQPDPARRIVRGCNDPRCRQRLDQIPRAGGGRPAH